MLFWNFFFNFCIISVLLKTNFFEKKKNVSKKFVRNEGKKNIFLGIVEK